MRLQPESLESLSRQLAQASGTASRIEQVDLSAFNRIVEYAPEDMTATVQVGMKLADFQNQLGAHKQWLPIDPPNPEQITISQLLDFNLSGPRRYGYGTTRDYLIGIKVALADGQIIKAGGKVVKNVAGYDLCKLFVGSRGTLGVIVEATFKLWPLPEQEIFLSRNFDSFDRVQEFFLQLLESAVRPVVLDLQNLNSKFVVVLGFAGAKEDVAFQKGRAGELGFTQEITLDYDAHFFSNSRIQKASVLPSQTVAQLKQLNPDKFVARLGNGVIYYSNAAGTGVDALQHVSIAVISSPPQGGGERQGEGASPKIQELMSRIKDTYDPKHIFPEFIHD
jgi:FAD/FMN-containing dehydrogenase